MKRAQCGAGQRVSWLISHTKPKVQTVLNESTEKYSYLPTIAVSNEDTVVLNLEMFTQHVTTLEVTGMNSNSFSIANPPDGVRTNTILQHTHKPFRKVLGLAIGQIELFGVGGRLGLFVFRVSASAGVGPSLLLNI